MRRRKAGPKAAAENRPCMLLTANDWPLRAAMIAPGIIPLETSRHPTADAADLIASNAAAAPGSHHALRLPNNASNPPPITDAAPMAMYHMV